MPVNFKNFIKTVFIPRRPGGKLIPYCRKVGRHPHPMDSHEVKGHFPFSKREAVRNGLPLPYRQYTNIALLFKITKNMIYFTIFVGNKTENVMYLSDFESIIPYTDEEARVALAKIADHPMVEEVSKFCFPEEDPKVLSNILKTVKGVDDFQIKVMSRIINYILERTATSLTYDGIEYFKEYKRYLILSNHRDIILDPAFLQLLFFKHSLPFTEIAVGDNLISNKIIESLIRSNRMIKVARGISAKELYYSSLKLSKYIRQNITCNRSSVWLAQRQGRTKDGNDRFEQGLLKMLDMSGSGNFAEDFDELNIMPMSISYEYEPCDILKARELYISKRQKYVKAPNEDLNSILTGIKQFKGRIHISFSTPLAIEEIAEFNDIPRAERFPLMRQRLGDKIIRGYKLWKTNYMAYDILASEGAIDGVNNEARFISEYTPDQLIGFKAYVDAQLGKVEPELDRAELRDIFLRIYANPVINKGLNQHRYSCSEFNSLIEENSEIRQ